MKRILKSITLVICMVIMLTLTSCKVKNPFAKDYNEYKAINYDKDEKDLVLNVYTPKERKENNLKAVLFISGDDWKSEVTGSDTDLCKAYAKKGYVTATMTYKNLGVYGNDENTLWTICNNLHSALIKLKSFCAQLEINVTDVVLHGTYSGGHIAAFYAWALQGEGSEYLSPIPIRCVQVIASPMRFEEEYWAIKRSDGNLGIKTACKLYGSYGIEGYVQKDGSVDVSALTEEKRKEILEMVTPLTYLTETSVPIIMAYGAKDDEILYKHCTALEDALKEVKLDYHKFDYTNSGHAMMFNPTAKEEMYKLLDSILADGVTAE